MNRTMRAIGIVLCCACGTIAIVSIVRAGTAVREARGIDATAESRSRERIEGEIRALHKEITELERLKQGLRIDEPCSIDVSAEPRAMLEWADRHSVTLGTISADPGGASVGVSAFGSGPAVREWIRRTDGMVSNGCAAVTRFELVASGRADVLVKLIVTYRSDDEPPLGVPRSRLQAVIDSWPAAAPSQFAAAFERGTTSAPDQVLDPATVAAPSASSTPTPGGTRAAPFAHPARVTYLGTVSYSHETVTGITERFAVRIEPEDIVAVLGVGETAFGWSLVDADTAKLVVERQGVAYEIDRLSPGTGRIARRLRGSP